MQSLIKKSISLLTLHNDRIPGLPPSALRTLTPREDVGVSVQGHMMFARRLDRIIALLLRKYSLFETSEDDMLCRLVKEGSIVLDVGANLGYYSLKFAKWVGPEGMVYAFEPEPENYRLLARNIGENGYVNVTAVNAAVSDKDGVADLYISDTHGGDHRVYNPGDRRRRISVKAVSIDGFLGDISPSFVKIDIQGHEYYALKGMETTIRMTPDVIILSQFFPRLMKKAGVSPEEFLGYIDDLGLSVYLMDDGGRRVTRLNRDGLWVLFECTYYWYIIITRIPEDELYARIGYNPVKR